MSKKIIVGVIFALLFLCIAVLLVTKENKKRPSVQTAKNAVEVEDNSDLVFYNLERNPTKVDSLHNQKATKKTIEACTTDMLCAVKNKGIENPYDIIINQSNENISVDSIAEKDRMDAERFALSLESEPNSNQKNETLDLIDQLSAIQEDLDIHKGKAQEKTQ